MADSQPELHVKPNERGTGYGFGDGMVVVYTKDGPKTGPLLAEVHAAAIAKWANDPTDTRLVTDKDIVEADLLGPAIFNRLLHIDTTELVRLLPKILESMPHDHRELLFRDVSAVAPAIWEAIAKERPQLVTQGFGSLSTRTEYLTKLWRPGPGTAIASSGNDITFNDVSMELIATILPTLFHELDTPARKQIIESMAKGLHKAHEDKAFFGPLGDPTLNQIVITNPNIGMCEKIGNNGRALMIRSKNGPQLHFQGRGYISDNLHFHPLKNITSRGRLSPVRDSADNPLPAIAEIRSYTDPAHEALCKTSPEHDPNKDVVGQLHAVFTAPGNHALLLAADVRVQKGKHNAEFGRYIDFLKEKKQSGKQLQPLTLDEYLVADTIPFNALACFPDSFAQAGIPEAPFMSLHLGGLNVHSLDQVTHQQHIAATAPRMLKASDPVKNVVVPEGKSETFFNGVHMVAMQKPVLISPEQLRDLRALQPELYPLDNETAVNPSGRYSPAQENQTWGKRYENPKPPGFHQR